VAEARESSDEADPASPKGRGKTGRRRVQRTPEQQAEYDQRQRELARERKRKQNRKKGEEFQRLSKENAQNHLMQAEIVQLLAQNQRLQAENQRLREQLTLPTRNPR
jgi:hypothetical protein